MTTAAGADLTDLDNFAHGFPHELFALIRREAPVFWHEPTVHTPDGEGFWSVAKHDDTLTIMRDSTTFSSETGGSRPYGGTILPDLPTAGMLLNMMDDPRHQRVRRLVSGGLTPRTIRRMEEELRRRTVELLDAAIDKEMCDFVVDVAGELPMQAICILLGVPEADRHQVFEWIEYSFDFRDRDAFEETDGTRTAAASLYAYGAELIEAKRVQPTDDMLSVVVHATLADEDPPRLMEQELQLFFALLFSAGADTTRNAVAGGVLELARHPDQLARLRDDRGGLSTAIEEIVRWTSPSAYNRRTATRDVDLRGFEIRAGDKVVFWEASANRDEDVFVDASRFDVGRDPNPHLGFGHGVHHCLSANLARLETRVILTELLERVQAIDVVGEPEWTRSNKHTGLRHVPLRLHPIRAGQ
jgi:cytochrome P450